MLDIFLEAIDEDNLADCPLQQYEMAIKCSKNKIEGHVEAIASWRFIEIKNQLSFLHAPVYSTHYHLF